MSCMLFTHYGLTYRRYAFDGSISKDTWAMNNYDVGPTGYDDSPVYTWDALFDLDVFKNALQNYNKKETSAFYSNIELLTELRHGDSLCGMSLALNHPIVCALIPFSFSSGPRSASDHLGRQCFKRVDASERYFATDVHCPGLCEVRERRHQDLP